MSARPALVSIDVDDKEAMMETGANIVRRYAKSEPVKRIDIICAYYENFTSIIDSFEVGVFHLISCEKALNCKSKFRVHD